MMRLRLRLRRVLRLSVGLGVVGLSAGLSPALGAQEAPLITPDGRYVVASVRKTMSAAEVATLVVQATRGPWRRELPGGSSPRLVPDGQTLLWQRGDTLWRVALGRAEAPRAVAAGVRSYELLGRARGGPWLLYRVRGADELRGAGEALVLRQLATGRERRWADVSEYGVAPDEGTLLLRIPTKGASTGPAPERTALHWVTLPLGAERTIWTGPGRLASGSAAFAFDAAGRQLVFMVETPRDGGGQQTLWHYAAGAPRATVLVEDGMPGVETGFTVAAWGKSQPARFSANGRRVFFRLREPARPQPPPLPPGAVDIWSYTDAMVQSQQLIRLGQRRAYAAVVLLPERRVVRLERTRDVLLGSSGLAQQDALSDEHALVCAFEDDVIRTSEIGIAEPYTLNDYNWSRAAQCSVTLVRLRDGTRAVLCPNLRNTSATFPYFRLSPDGRYVVFYDPWRKEYGSYELASGTTRPLTRGLAARWEDEDPERLPRDFHRPVGIQGWLPGDAAVLVADHDSDLWRLDLTGRKSPVQLTQGYARRQQLPLYWPAAGSPAAVLDRQAGLLVEAQHPRDARRLALSGWYRVRLDRAAEPRAVVPFGGPYRYSNLALGASAGDTVYVATRENVTEPPGTWYTRDFRTWTPVTDGRPEQRRPLPRQLLTWKTLDGHEAQGVLWLPPRGLEPGRKYPVIVVIYERQVSSLEFGPFIPENAKVEREWTNAGYLRFYPNIHYTVGATGESVYNAVVAGVQHLATLPFVDSRRLGLWGHSFGGFESRYLLTRTSLFAAAFSASGHSNLLSFYGTEEKDKQGFSYMATAETGQFRLGVTPWERSEVYLRHSAVLHADKITTPLLLAHNYDDYRVPFSQSMELYAALRRLGKPVWLVAGYGGHFTPSVWAPYARQFFDHYLKGAPAPRWMTRGVPAARRGIDTGLELDTTVAGPGPGLLDTLGRAPLPERQLTQNGRRD